MNYQQKWQKISSCCHCPVGVSSDSEGTNFYFCTVCKKACDVVSDERILGPSESPQPSPSLTEEKCKTCGKEKWHCSPNDECGGCPDCKTVIDIPGFAKSICGPEPKEFCICGVQSELPQPFPSLTEEKCTLALCDEHEALQCETCKKEAHLQAGVQMEERLKEARKKLRFYELSRDDIKKSTRIWIDGLLKAQDLFSRDNQRKIDAEIAKGFGACCEHEDPLCPDAIAEKILVKTIEELFTAKDLISREKQREPQKEGKNKICFACEYASKKHLNPANIKNHNGCFYYPKFYIQCFNILASMYAQKRLNEEFGFKILGGKPHFSSRFVVVGPPAETDDKALICSGENADEGENWMDLLDALSLITFTEHMKNSSPPTS